MKKLRIFCLKIKVLSQGRRRSQSSCGRSVRKGELVQNRLSMTAVKNNTNTTSATTDLKKKDCTIMWLPQASQAVGDLMPSSQGTVTKSKRKSKLISDHMCQISKTLYWKMEF